MNENTKKLLTNFFAGYTVKKYKKGELLYKPGQDFGGVVYIKSGYVRTYTISSEGKEISIPLFKPLFYLSLISQLAGVKNKYYMEAITHTDVMVVPKDDFMKFIEKNLEVKDEIVKMFMKKFHDMTTSLSQIIAGDARNKILGLIYSLADEFGVKRDEATVIRFKVTHKMIASLTGLTRETATLQMIKLEKEGLINNDRREIVVLDMKKVEKMLG